MPNSRKKENGHVRRKPKERAEYALAHQLLIVEWQRYQVYSEMDAGFREELKMSDSEWKEITDMCRKLIPRLTAAKERREKPSEWHRVKEDEKKPRRTR